MPSRRALLRAGGSAALAALAGCARPFGDAGYPDGTVVFENRDDRYHKPTLRARLADGSAGGDGGAVTDDEIIQTRTVQAGETVVLDGLLGPGEWAVRVGLGTGPSAEARLSLPGSADVGRYLRVRMAAGGTLELAVAGG